VPCRSLSPRIILSREQDEKSFSCTVNPKSINDPRKRNTTNNQFVPQEYLKTAKRGNSYQ